jgi:CRISPR/Cas system-associated exonuclease Cas4 (RecB family)
MLDFKAHFVGRIDRKIRQGRVDKDGRPDSRVHVSDTVLCPREKIFRILNPEAPFNPKMRNWILSGEQIHAFAESILEKDRFETEKEIQTDTGLVGKVDIYIKEENRPVEYKSTRSAKRNVPKKFHINQLKKYMAILGSRTGTLFYQLTNDYSIDPFPSFDFQIDEKERRKLLQSMEEDRQMIEKAKKEKDPSIARAIRYNLDLNWLCKDCPFTTECMDIYSKQRANQFISS